MSWSNKIYEPEFQDLVRRNRRNKNRWAIILILAAIIIMPIVGAVQDELVNYSMIGFGIAILLAITFLISTLRTKHQRSWEGTVTEKYQKEEERIDRTRDSRDRHVYDKYNIIVIREDNGKKHKIEERANRWSKVYPYLNIGDRVRFHGGMELHFPYEKFDKSGDSSLICAFCGKEAPLTEDYCPKCHSPLLK